MSSDWDDPWVDVPSWGDVAEVLRDDWDRVVHPPLGLSLERVDGLLAFDVRGQWRARHRRGLHRLGFRPVALGGTDVWQWDVRPQLRVTDLSRSASPFGSLSGAGRSGPRALRLRMLLARDQLVREQAMRVLREVFRCEPGELHPCQATPGTSTAQVVAAVRANRWSSVTSGTPSCEASAT